jgi:hypothetical protein
MRKRILILSMISILLTAPAVWADVTIERWTRSNFVIGFESTSTTKIQGLKQYSRNNVKFESRLIGYFADDAPIVIITRVDKGLIWNLNDRKKTYIEAPLSAFDIDKMIKNKQAENKDEKTPEKSRYRLMNIEFKVNKAGAKEIINGFDCEEYDAVFTAVIEDTETDGRLTEIIETILFTTPETGKIFQAQQEEAAYYDALYKKLGLDGKSGMISRILNMDKANSPFKLTENDMKKYASEFSRIEGYPIRTIVKSRTIEDEKQKAACLKREQQENKGQTKQKQKDDSRKNKSDRGKPVIWFTSEVRKISLDPVKASTFEIPAKYKKVQN